MRLDCVDSVTAQFQDALDFMESHLDTGDSETDNSDEEEARQLSAAGAAAAALAAAAGGGGAAGSRAQRLALTLPPAAERPPAVVPVLPGSSALASKLMGSTVTRDYSSPSQSKRSIGGKRGSITLPASGAALAASSSLPSSTVPPQLPAAPSSLLPSPSSLTAASSSSSSSSSSSPSSKLGLGLGLKGAGPGSNSGGSGSSAGSSSSAATAAGSGASPLSSSSSGSGGPSMPGGLAGGSKSSSSSSLSSSAGSAVGLQLAPSHKPSSRAQYSSASSALQQAGGEDEDQRETSGGSAAAGSGGSGSSSGQSSDNDEEVIRVARPLAAKNRLLHRAAALTSSREFPSPKLGPRSLGTSPAGMGPRGVSAPNNAQQHHGSGGGQQAQSQAQQQQPRAPALIHAATIASPADSAVPSLPPAADETEAGNGSLHPSLTAPPSLSSFSSESGGDVALLPEPSSSLGSGGDGDVDAAGPGLILTEPAELGKDSELSDKEALGIMDMEEKDLVDEALERRPDPLQRLRKEVIVPVTASPKQYRSSLRLLTLAAESASNADGTAAPSATPDDAAQLPPAPAASAAEDELAGAVSTRAAHLSSGSGVLSPATAVPLSSAPSSVSPQQSSRSGSASSTPKPAFLRRLDSPESHHGQLIAAKARLQLLLNRALQTIPNLKTDAMPAAQRKLETALAKLEASTITQP